MQDRSNIGNRVIIQSGAIIGSDGHGYFQRKGVNYKIPAIWYQFAVEDDVIGGWSLHNNWTEHVFTKTVIKQVQQTRQSSTKLLIMSLLANRPDFKAQSAVEAVSRLGTT